MVPKVMMVIVDMVMLVSVLMAALMQNVVDAGLIDGEASGGGRTLVEAVVLGGGDGSADCQLGGNHDSDSGDRGDNGGSYAGVYDGSDNGYCCMVRLGEVMQVSGGGDVGSDSTGDGSSRDREQK